MKISQIELVRKVAIDFCIEFTENPYLCYTEHGFHAYFHTMLFNVIPENERFADWKGKKICVIQKEYRTANIEFAFLFGPRSRAYPSEP